MISVRLKLYEIMKDADLWDKARLLYACSPNFGSNLNPMLPTFASHYNEKFLEISEKYNDHYAIMLCSLKFEKESQIIQLMEEYRKNSKPLWIENLISIQFEPFHCCLSVKSNSYFIRSEEIDEKNKCRHLLPLDDHDEIHSVFIPFFIFAIPHYINYSRVYTFRSKILLEGNINKNKWMLVCGSHWEYKSTHFCPNEYISNIY